jgi:hypothetical protein
VQFLAGVVRQGVSPEIASPSTSPEKLHTSTFGTKVADVQEWTPAGAAGSPMAQGNTAHLKVELVLRSGGTHAFEISEDILDDLEYLLREGRLPFRELCSTWLRVPPTDPAALIRVFGKRGDGTDVRIELSCDDQVSGETFSRPHAS